MMDTVPAIGSLFSGYGGLDLGVVGAIGGSVAWHCDNNPAADAILAHHWPGVPNLGDITAVDWGAVPSVDVLTGGFPCQDLSTAGMRRGLKPGTRSGLWTHMAAAIDALRPRLVVIENVRGILSAEAHSSLERDCWCVGDSREPALRALGAVLGDLADLRYDVRWISLRASDVGAPHQRVRVFIVAHPADADGSGPQGRRPLQHAAPRFAWAGGVGPRVMTLPTPVATQHDRGKAWQLGEPAPGGQLYLGQVVRAVMTLPTPRASDGTHGGPGMRNSSGSVDALPGVAALLPTPTLNMLPERDTAHQMATRDSPGIESIAEQVLRRGWGPYAPAIARWEAVMGRPAPAPLDDRGRLSPLLVEWMMGLPQGWVTDPAIGLSRAQQLTALGNGVVPQQAEAALRAVLP